MREYTRNLLENLLSKTDFSDTAFFVSEHEDKDGVSLYDERQEIVLYLTEALGADFIYNTLTKSIQRDERPAI